MRKGIAAAMLLAGASVQTAAASEPVTAEDAIARYRPSFPPVTQVDCPRGPAGPDIVICGRTGPDPNRLPLPVPPLPGARSAGEGVDQRSAEDLAEDRCNNVGNAGACGGFVPILPFALWVIKTAVKAAKKE